MLKFDIRHPDGRAEELRIEADRALIGSGGHCEIRLGVDQAALEHILVTATPTGLMAEARSFQPPATVNGAPFTRTQLVPGAILGVGYTQIAVTPLEGVGQAAGGQTEKKRSPATIAMAILIIPLALFVIFDEPEDDTVAAAPEEAPVLWKEEPASCPQAGREQALSVAQDKLGIARSKQERRPFHVPDGVESVVYYETAAACYRVGGDEAQAKALAKVAADLKKDIDEDFRTHRVRLEHAMSTKNVPVMQKEVRVLLAFTEGQDMEYRTWLANLERRLKLKYGDVSKGKQ